MEKQSVLNVMSAVMWLYLGLWLLHTHVQTSASSWVHPSQHSQQEGPEQCKMQPDVSCFHFVESVEKMTSAQN